MSTSKKTDTGLPAMGQPVDRVDGRLKVTGAARYSAEMPVRGLAYAVLATSPIAKGRIQGLQLKAAQGAPGVLAVLTHENLPKLARQPKAFSPGPDNGFPGMSFAPLQGPEIHYGGQPVAVVVAETLEQAEHAVGLLEVSYAEQKPAAFPTATAYEPKSLMWGIPGVLRRGTPQEALASSPVRVEATYTHEANHHVPMEPSATVAVWEGEQLTLYDATQGVASTQGTVASLLGIPRDNIRVVTHFLGGGFGCKGATWPHTFLCAATAKAVGRPVKLVLSRRQTFTSHGHREQQVQKLALGATREGKLTALVHEKAAPVSPFDEYVEPNGMVLQMFYAVPNLETRYRLSRTNFMTPTFMRAPGEAPGMFALESSMDELAYALGLDPLELRLRNHADVDPSTGQAFSSKSLKQCYARGAELFGWSKRNPKPRSTRDGRYLVGVGMASATYPVHANQGRARARLFSDGRVRVQCSATDLGTGTYTIATQVAAQTLGLPVDKVRFELGDTLQPTGPMSGGSVTAGTVGSSVYMACKALLANVIALAVKDARSPLSGASPEEVDVKDGRLFLRGKPDKGETYAALLGRNRREDLEAFGEGQYGGAYTPQEAHPESRDPQAAKQAGLVKYSMHSFGAHFCEVRVDEELGQVRIARWVGVFGAGRILNAKTAMSQMRGGAVYGIGSALHESTHADPRYARWVNTNLADYHVPSHADIPEMTIEFVPEEDPHINVLGVKGVGELGMVGVAAAVANAVFHATGKRIRDLPITPDKLL
jgi:xanthine dehydrogenase YagR molybdenum-binding subunit